MPNHFVLEVEEGANLVAVIKTIGDGEAITDQELPKIKQALKEHLALEPEDKIELNGLPAINKNFVYVGKYILPNEFDENPVEETYTLSPIHIY